LGNRFPITSVLSYTVHLCPHLVRTDLITIATNSAIERDFSERSSVSALGKVVVSNGDSGFDVYSLDSGAQVRSVAIPPGTACTAAPVLFIHGGFAFVGGCLLGGLRFWDTESGARIQNMKHGMFIVAFAIA
jgi:hypothetical protein